jgi:restriction endonuclease Mrr
MSRPPDAASTARELAELARLAAVHQGSRDDVLLALIQSSNPAWRGLDLDTLEDLATLAVAESHHFPAYRDAGAGAWQKVVASLADDDALDRLTIYEALTDAEGEHFVARFLQRCGNWTDASVTQRSRDGGIDVEGHFDRGFGSLGECVAQVKWYRPGCQVSLDEVKAFITSAAGRLGYFVTTSHFSTAAGDLQDKYSNVLVLLDGGDLAQHMGRHLRSEG